MANPLSAPRRTPSRGSRNAALAAALLVAATLAGTVSPAAAADGTAEKLYASNEDVEKEMADKAPVADLESVMSYPKGLERDKDGNLVPVTQEDVKARVKYEPAQALTDAKAAAKNWSENTDNNSDAREMIKQLSDSALTEPDVIGADTRDDNIATAMAEVNSSASFCEGVNAAWAPERGQGQSVRLRRQARHEGGLQVAQAEHWCRPRGRGQEDLQNLGTDHRREQHHRRLAGGRKGHAQGQRGSRRRWRGRGRVPH